MKNEFTWMDRALKILVFLCILVLVVFLTSCSTTVPTTAKFPDAPGKGSMEPCPNLAKLQDGVKLSDVSKTISINYETYYSCAVKADAWQEWYQIQKHIHESAGK